MSSLEECVGSMEQIKPGVKHRTQFIGAWIPFRNKAAALGAVIILALVGSAIFAGWLTPYPPERQYFDAVLQPPSMQHPLGTDELGRDQLSRIMHGGRASLMVGFVSMSVALTLGVGLGLVSGYYGGWLDSVIMRLQDTILSLPPLLLAIFFVAVLGPSMVNAMIAVGIVYTPAFARITRANVLSLTEAEFVAASKSVGVPTERILFRHILPNCLSPIIVQLTLGVGYAILVEAALSFLGLGVQPPDPAWGTMLNRGRTFISQAPWLTTFPGLAIFLTVLGFNFLGDGLREYFDPRLRRGR